MTREEQDLQISVMDHFRLRGMPGAFAFHVPNAGKRSFHVGKKLKAAGLTAGVPDLVFIHGGDVFALELKSPTGRLLPSQRATIPAMERAGAKVAVADNIDEALITLECWGILKRSVNHRVSSNSSQDNAGAS